MLRPAADSGSVICGNYRVVIYLLVDMYAVVDPRIHL